MSKALKTELEKLDPEERVRLAHDLLDSVASEGAREPVTEAQRELVRRRLAEYRANPNEPVATLADIKMRFGFALGSGASRRASAVSPPRNHRCGATI